jgi:RecA-family ATPase
MGKPKQGKSSLARYEAVCVAKGQPFLERDTKRGEVMLISLEDPRRHIDNCLAALGYNENTDAMIHIVDQVAPRVDESLDAIEAAIKENPEIRLVIIDTMAKLLRVADQNDYSLVLNSISKISAFARRHPHVHVQGLAHSKKAKTDDRFDGMLGSTAFRGETDTNIALDNEAGKRVITAETRIGRSIETTLLEASTVVRAGAEVVSGYTLDVPFDHWQKLRADKAERKRAVIHDERIIAFLKGKADKTATQAEVLREVKGRIETKVETIQKLISRGVVTAEGTPKVLHLHESAVDDFINTFGPDGGADE